MRRRALAALLGTCFAGAAAVAIVGAGDERTLAFTQDIRAGGPVAVVAPGRAACQWGIDSEARFEVVQLLLGTYGRLGPRLTVTVRDNATGRAMAQGRLGPGAADNKPASVRLRPSVPDGPRVGVCVANEGPGRVALYGGPPDDAPTSQAFVGNRPADGDIRLIFYRAEPRSALALVPEIAERAALFRPAPLGAWTFWILLAAMAIGVPLLLGAALRRGVDG
jgi:hypothetical protein